MKLVAGNWKMNGMRADGLALAAELVRRAREADGAEPVVCELLICPPATLLAMAHEALTGSGIALGGQDCHPAAKGAFTGDISAEMLADAGCRYVILGHSERRHGHGESNALIREKVAAARRAGLVPVLCVGETLAQRQAGEASAVVAAQLAGCLEDHDRVHELVVAYEPVWAIGTGLTPGLDDIRAMHAVIRSDLSPETRILYGGSVNPANAAAILGLPDVDGALVGGASLAADTFWAIARACG
ncbi:MAG TPA: triose-phosphate isomerase [Stellaceae bacterium]|nr:triose-phosphate isomerase [Stellaceae bacterium]